MTIRTQVSVPAKATIAAEVYTFRSRQYIFVGLDGDRRSRSEILDRRYVWSLYTSFERQNQTKRSSPAEASTDG